MSKTTGRNSESRFPVFSLFSQFHSVLLSACGILPEHCCHIVLPDSLNRLFEYYILLLLVKNQGKVFSINQIYESIWNEEAIGADNTVAVHIRHIREKIEINPKDPQYLKVVWGVGYKIEKIEPR